MSHFLLYISLLIAFFADFFTSFFPRIAIGETNGDAISTARGRSSGRGASGSSGNVFSGGTAEPTTSVSGDGASVATDLDIEGSADVETYGKVGFASSDIDLYGAAAGGAGRDGEAAGYESSQGLQLGVEGAGEGASR